MKDIQTFIWRFSRVILVAGGSGLVGKHLEHNGRLTCFSIIF